MVVVFTIFVQENPPSVENCQLRIEPTWPASVSVPPFVPEQTVASAVTLPPTVVGLTVMIRCVETADAQVPLERVRPAVQHAACFLYTSDAAND